MTIRRHGSHCQQRTNGSPEVFGQTRLRQKYVAACTFRALSVDFPRTAGEDDDGRVHRVGVGTEAAYQLDTIECALHPKIFRVHVATVVVRVNEQDGVVVLGHRCCSRQSD
jgi:hypothetical protein